jgi:hypothetical protein
MRIRAGSAEIRHKQKENCDVTPAGLSAGLRTPVGEASAVSLTSVLAAVAVGFWSKCTTGPRRCML